MDPNPVVVARVGTLPRLALALAFAWSSGRLVMVEPTGSTPTTAVISAAYSYLSSLNDGAPKFILLATDGVPTCGTDTCAQSSPGGAPNQCDDANAIAAVQSAHDLGVSTFVLGIGTGGSGDATLSQMAMAGGFPRNADPPYYPVGSGADLMAAFETIAALVAP